MLLGTIALKSLSGCTDNGSAASGRSHDEALCVSACVPLPQLASFAAPAASAPAASAPAVSPAVATTAAAGTVTTAPVDASDPGVTAAAA